MEYQIYKGYMLRLRDPIITMEDFEITAYSIKFVL